MHSNIQYWWSIAAIVSGLAVGQPVLAAGASFDCATAKAPLEQIICSDDRLAAADTEVAQAFSAYLQANPTQHDEALEIQRTWLKDRLIVCEIPATGKLRRSQFDRAANCLTYLYNVRISDLHGRVPSPVGRTDDDKAVCKGLADRIATFRPPEPTWSGDLLEAIAHTGDPFTKFANESEEAANLSTTLNSRIPPEHKPGNDPMQNQPHWDRLGGSSIVALESEGGSAHCQGFDFFDSAGIGELKSIPPPEQVDTSAYCWGDANGRVASLGEIGGRPTFAVDEFSGSREDVRLIARRDDSWVRSCRLHIDWKPVFALGEDACDHAECKIVRERAISMVAALDSTDNLLSYWDKIATVATPQEHKDALESYLRDRPPPGWKPLFNKNEPAPTAHYWTINVQGKLLTVAYFDGADRQFYYSVAMVSASHGLRVFNLAPSDDENLNLSTVSLSKTSYTAFGWDSAMIPLTINGDIYLLRIGHGHFGWRTDRDYLVALYGIRPFGLEQLGSMLVTKGRLPDPKVTILDPSLP